MNYFLGWAKRMVSPMSKRVTLHWYLRAVTKIKPKRLSS